MAGRDLTYTIGIDASDAAAGLRKLESSVRSTMRTVDDELSDGATAGDKLAASMDRVADEMKSDFASAAIAAERLQQALKDAGSGLNVGDAITSLRRMGISFDEITQDADKLAASLKQLDDVRVAGVKDLDSVAPGLSSKLDDVGKSADSSKSALANMIGNSFQTMGQSVGIVGDLGVGIGQLGEYAADAKLDGEGMASVFKNMAGVVGPMAALALATKAVSDVMGRFTASQDRTTQSVEMWEQALQSGGDASDNYADSLRDLGKVTLDVTREQSKLANVTAELDSHWYSTGIGVHLLTDLLGLSTDETKDMTKALADAGLTVDRWTELIEGGAPAVDTLREALTHTNLSADEQADVLTTLAQAQEDHAAATKNDGVIQEFFGDTTAETTKKQEEAERATKEAAEAHRQATEAAKQHAIALAGANGELADITSTFAEMARRGDALTSIFDLGNAPLDLASGMRDIAEGIGGLKEAAQGINLKAALDPANLGQDKLLDALDALRPQIQAKISEAFAAGGPQAAQDTAAWYVEAIRQALGGKLTADEVRNLLGLDDLTTTLQVAVDQSSIARAKSELDVLVGVGGETPFTASLKLAVDSGQLSGEAARAIAEWGLAEEGVKVPLDPVTDPAALAEAQGFMSSFAEQNPVVQPLVGDPTGVTDAAADAKGDVESTTATMPLDADRKQADAEAQGFVKTTEAAKPVVNIGASVVGALITMAIINAIAQQMAPTVNVGSDISKVLGDLSYLSSRRPQVPVEAYLADYPTATEIANRIGRPKVPVDIVVGSSIRITGVRD